MIEETPTPSENSLEQAAAASQRLSFGERQRQRAEIEARTPDFNLTRPGTTIIKAGEATIDAALSPLIRSQIGETKEAPRIPEGKTMVSPSEVDTSGPLSSLLAEQLSTVNPADLNTGTKPFVPSERHKHIRAALEPNEQEAQTVAGGTPISPLLREAIQKREDIDTRYVTPTEPNISTKFAQHPDQIKAQEAESKSSRSDVDISGMYDV